MMLYLLNISSNLLITITKTCSHMIVPVQDSVIGVAEVDVLSSRTGIEVDRDLHVDWILGPEWGGAVEDLQSHDWRLFRRFGVAEVYVLATGTRIEVLGELVVARWDWC